MTITLGSRLVHLAKLHVPWSGRWLLEVHFDGPPPSGLVSAQWGNTRFAGTVLPTKSGEVITAGVATIVGGFGWQNEVPALWLVDAAAPPARVASQLAQAVGETLVIGAGSIKQGRTAYSRPKLFASAILRELLTDGAVWWVDVDGTTYTATDRPTSTCTAEVLQYEPEGRRVKLDIEDPSQALVGATIPAKGERFPEAQRIREINITASDKGIECWALTEPDNRSSRVAELIEAIAQNAPPNARATLRGATVQSQDAQRRVSIRYEERDEELDDAKFVPAWCGVPGVSAQLFAGTRTLAGFDRADPTNPFVALWSPYGQPGHVPQKVFHEANDEIRFVGTSAGVGRFGTLTQPVALATNLVTYLQALEAWALSVDLAVGPIIAALPPPAPATYSAAVTARTNAAGIAGANIAAIQATKLEAE